MWLLLAVILAVSVIGGWYVWFSPSAQRHRERHEAAWSPVRVPGTDGLSDHQRECERAIVHALEGRKLTLRNRRVDPFRLTKEDPKEALVYAEVPELGAELWISASQTDIDTPSSTLRLEEWDAATPADHIEIVRKFVEGLPLLERGDV